MTPEDYKSIRVGLGLTCAQMAAVLRLRGNRRADHVREYERGTRQTSGSVDLLYQLIAHGGLPEFVFDIEERDNLRDNLEVNIGEMENGKN